MRWLLHGLLVVLGTMLAIPGVYAEKNVLGCEIVEVICHDEGLTVGLQYVGFIDTLETYIDRDDRFNNVLSSVFLELAWQFEHSTDLSANWLYQPEQSIYQQNPFDLGTKEAFHIANLEVGKSIYIGPHTRARFRYYLGAQYLHIKHQGRFIRQQFDGFGPRAGAEAQYWFNPRVAVDAAMAMSILVGDSYIKRRIFQRFSTSSRIMTAGVDGRLGVKTDLSKVYPTDFTAKTPIELLAGYRWYVYRNALNYTLPDQGLLIGQGLLGSHGLYVGLRVKAHKSLFFA